MLVVFLPILFYSLQNVNIVHYTAIGPLYKSVRIQATPYGGAAMSTTAVVASMSAYVIDIPCASCDKNVITQVFSSHHDVQRNSTRNLLKHQTFRRWFTPRPVLHNADLYEEVSDYSIYNEGDGIFEDYFTLRRGIVFKYTVTFQKMPPRCGKDDVIVAVISSESKDFVRRNIIRNTWSKNKHKFKTKVVFVIQHSPQNASLLKNEHLKYNDVIIFNEPATASFTESKNASMATLKWVSTLCPNVKHVIKTNDRTFINLKALTEFTDQNNLTGSVVGAIERTALAMRSGKYSVTRANFPFVYFPPYASGGVYVLSGDLVGSLLYASRHLPHQLPSEDVYLTGVLARAVSARHIHHVGFVTCRLSSSSSKSFLPCGLKYLPSTLVIQNVSPKDMWALYAKL